jgi:hypothetical protein
MSREWMRRALAWLERVNWKADEAEEQQALAYEAARRIRLHKEQIGQADEIRKERLAAPPDSDCPGEGA